MSAAVDGPGVSVVVCTYDWPEALDAVLRSLADQSDSHFDVVVTDDGSGPETASLVERWRPAFEDRLAYVWQPDEGFRAAAARNRGALVAGSDLLVFVDGDCIARRHFVRTLRASWRPGWFAAANRLRLSEELTERVLRERIPLHRWPLPRWLLHTRADLGVLAPLTARDRRRVGSRRVPEFAPRDNAYCCLAVAAADFEAANGYDMRYVGWGDEDVDLAIRLRRLGLRCGHAGPLATPLHLWHPSREDLGRTNWWLLQETEQSDRVEAMEGLRELEAVEAL